MPIRRCIANPEHSARHFVDIIRAEFLRLRPDRCTEFAYGFLQFLQGNLKALFAGNGRKILSLSFSAALSDMRL